MQKTIVLLCLISLFVISCEARWRCTFSWKKSDPHCIRMNADAVQLRSTFGKCFSGANADFTGEGTFDFPANETLKAGDWQYRIYEDGVKDGLKETITADLEAAAMRITILEEELHAERAKKWNAVRKLKLIDTHGGNIGELRYVLDKGEALTLHDKIEILKDGVTL